MEQGKPQEDAGLRGIVCPTDEVHGWDQNAQDPVYCDMQKDWSERQLQNGKTRTEKEEKRR